MRFWVIAPGVYAGTLAAGIAGPAAIAFLRQPSPLQAGLLYTLGLAMLAGASFALTLMLARVLFPPYWWLGQVLGEDVFELEGVYFVGVRMADVPDRLQRMVFGAGEKFRRWDAAFGLIWLLLLVVHGLGAGSAKHSVETMMPRPVRLPETMHQALLSDLPVMRALHKPWSPDPALKLQLQGQAEQIQNLRGKTEADWFKLAQLHLLRAYKVRKGLADAYTFSPMDRAFFERGNGAQSADDLNQILSIPVAKRAPVTRGALTLLGFFYLCEYNYGKAERLLAQALALEKARDETGIPTAWTRLLAAQVALQQGDSDRSDDLLTRTLDEAGLPAPLRALAVEHLAEAKRLDGSDEEVGPLLDKAGALYASLGDGGGQARIHLRRAVWLVDQGEARTGTEELSQASADAEAAGDVFALDMVVRVTHLLPALR
jgi:hypothetical protein